MYVFFAQAPLQEFISSWPVHELLILIVLLIVFGIFILNQNVTKCKNARYNVFLLATAIFPVLFVQFRLALTDSFGPSSTIVSTPIFITRHTCTIQSITQCLVYDLIEYGCNVTVLHRFIAYILYKVQV